MNTKLIALVLLWLGAGTSYAQTLHLPDAINLSIQNYEKFKSKQALIRSSEEETRNAKSQYLPDVTLLAQQNFGTVNAQNGPLYSFGGLGAASTSMPLKEQNWNAAFGSLYLTNINWNLFTFGRVRNQVRLAEAEEAILRDDLSQEVFNHQIQVAATYFNLLASQRLKFVQEQNLQRARVFLATTESKAGSGLIPEVEASLARAEVSNAQSAQIKAYDKELDYTKKLSVLMGVAFQSYELDSTFHHSTPFLQGKQAYTFESHPAVRYLNSRRHKSLTEEKLQRSTMLPSLMAFGVLQGRGSGFGWNYVQDNNAFSRSYFAGAGIQRGNFLAGVTLSWNFTNFYRNAVKSKSQQEITRALQHDHTLLTQELSAQTTLADRLIDNAFKNWEETGTQLSSAREAFQQQTALYENGLSTITDFTQYLYALNRAEIDHELARTNIWQALVLKSAALGDINILLNEIRF
jgi:outer membrane protein